MLALVLILSTIDIGINQNHHMSLISAQKCINCDKEYEDWSCDYCYTKYVIKRVGM